ncbi:MAG: nitroreductase, partial [Deltaproteobacteria bacterium HGW-Deltaproteobacteria-20]
IGDILENGEIHAELLQLPKHTFPVAMLCFGHPMASGRRAPRYTEHVVHTNHYHRLNAEELEEVSRGLAETHAPHGLAPGTANYGQAVYRRKFASEFMREMNRSVTWWMERWQSQ